MALGLGAPETQDNRHIAATVRSSSFTAACLVVNLNQSGQSIGVNTR
jgi:hypothetical protein